MGRPHSTGYEYFKRVGGEKGGTDVYFYENKKSTGWFHCCRGDVSSGSLLISGGSLKIGYKSFVSKTFSVMSYH